MPKQAEEMVEKVLASLIKKNPNTPVKELRSKAFAVVQSFWKQKFGKPAF